MATKKPQLNTYTVTGTFKNLQIGAEVKATDLAAAVEASKNLKFSSFIKDCGDVHDYDGPQITAIWKNE